MKQLINKIIDDLKSNFPDLCNQEDSIQFQMLQDLEKLKTEVYDIEYSFEQLLDKLNP